MKTILSLLPFFCAFNVLSQNIELKKDNLEAVNVFMTLEKMDKQSVVKVEKDSTVKAVDEPTFVRLKNVMFTDGTIEVNVLSKL